MEEKNGELQRVKFNIARLDRAIRKRALFPFDPSPGSYGQAGG